MVLDTSYTPSSLSPGQPAPGYAQAAANSQQANAFGTSLSQQAQSSIFQPSQQNPFGFFGTAKPGSGVVPGAEFTPQQVQDATSTASPGTGKTPQQLIDQYNALKSFFGLGGAGSGLNYQIYSPQEQATRGLAQQGLVGQALDSNKNFIGQQLSANTQKNTLAGQAIAQQRAQTLQQALIDRHTAQGSAAASGASQSQGARDTLGNVGDQQYYAAMGNTNPAQPWVGNGQGTIQNTLTANLQNLYNQAANTQIDYSVGQGGLNNQLAQLLPQYGQMNQQNATYNKILSGDYNTNATPEQQALQSALRSANYGF